MKQQFEAPVPFTAAELAALPDQVPLRDLWRQLGLRGIRYDYGCVWRMAINGLIPATQSFGGIWFVKREDVPTVFEAVRLRDRRFKPKKTAAA